MPKLFRYGGAADFLDYRAVHRHQGAQRADLIRAAEKLARRVAFVKQAARLDKHRQRVFAQIRAKRYRLFIQIRQQHVAAFETQTAVGVFKMFRHLTQRRVRACLRCQLLAGASQPRFAAREFNNRIDFHLLQT